MKTEQLIFLSRQFGHNKFVQFSLFNGLWFAIPHTVPTQGILTVSPRYSQGILTRYRLKVSPIYPQGILKVALKYPQGILTRYHQTITKYLISVTLVHL